MGRVDGSSRICGGRNLVILSRENGGKNGDLENCTTTALSFDQKPNPISGDLATFKIHHAVEMIQCSRCKTPFVPLPAPVLVKLYGDPLPEEIQSIRFLCEKCRKKVATRHLKEAARGQMARRGSDLIATKKAEESKE